MGKRNPRREENSLLPGGTSPHSPLSPEDSREGSVSGRGAGDWIVSGAFGAAHLGGRTVPNGGSRTNLGVGTAAESPAPSAANAYSRRRRSATSSVVDRNGFGIRRTRGAMGDDSTAIVREESSRLRSLEQVLDETRLRDRVL